MIDNIGLATTIIWWFWGGIAGLLIISATLKIIKERKQK
jgi:hypothetical protein